MRGIIRPVQVREALPKDVPALRGLLEEVLGHKLDEEEAAKLAHNLLYFLSGQGNALLLLEDGPRLVGALSVWVRQGVFDDLPVARVDRVLLAPDAGEKEALMLLEQAAALARSVGAGDLEVLLEDDPFAPETLPRAGLTPRPAYRARLR